MPFLPLRHVPVHQHAAEAYDAWLGDLAARLDDPKCDRDDLCRDVLTGLYFPAISAAATDALSATARIALAQLDPRNVTMEPEYYAETDLDRFYRVKPLLWLWEMFDKSAAGENIALGIRFRRILARHVFRRCGRNFKCFQFVKLSFGYNMEVGDNVVVHRHVLLDDRGGIVLGDKVSIADFCNVYSHTHDLVDQRVVISPKTVLGEGVRLAYHSTVLAGTHLEADSMLGALALATRDVASGQVAIGIPAQPRITKPPLDERSAHPGTTDPLAD